MRKMKAGTKVTTQRLERRQFYADYMRSAEWFRKREAWLKIFEKKMGHQVVYCFGH